MSITEYQINDISQWNAVVYSFEDYDVFYLAEYAMAFMEENPKYGEPILVLYEDGTDRAMNVVFRRDIARDEKMQGKLKEGEYYDISTPYGYGGFWGHITDWEKLNNAYAEYCINHRYVCEFVRFDLFSDYSAHYNGKVETRTLNVVRSLEMSMDEMWMDFKQKVRKNVNKARSYDLKILIENTNAHLDDFLRIYNETMERTSARKEYFFTKHFFDHFCNMKENATFFYVVFEGKIVSVELVIYGLKNCYSFLGGTDANYMYVRPNEFLKYEVIRWAKEKGLHNFVLGGGYGANDGIFQYKYTFAPHGVVDFYIGTKIFNQNAYQMLKELRTDELDESFFPIYRS